MKTAASLLAFCVLVPLGPAQAAAEPDSGVCGSLAPVDPAPEWFRDAKFGIYFHWGVYSVPAFANEWYPRNLYFEDSPENRHHREVFGAPEDWPYQNFILGARDRSGRWVQFAPKLKSDGGSFDPAEWARLFAASGARFAGPVAEHHDGFSMWASRVNPWNVGERGPELDLVGLLTDAIRRQGLKVILSMHHAYNITGFFEAVPRQEDPDLRILYGQQGKAANEALWLAKHEEIIDGYHPDVLWQDFNLHLISPEVLREFLADYYDEASRRGQEVVATYKDGLDPRCAVLDYERGGPPEILEHAWLTDDAISSSSWSYTEGIEYYSKKQVLHGLIDRVSKNGNLLLNVSPRADGTIPDEQRELLLAIGDWLARYGEAIYATRPWAVWGEGPTRMGGAHGVMGPPLEGTAADVRYTRSKDHRTLYAILLGREEGEVEITLSALSSERIDGDRLTRVALVDGAAGRYLPLEARQDEAGLHLSLPARNREELATVLRLDFAPGIPRYDDFADFDASPHYHLVPADGDGQVVLGGDLQLSQEPRAAASQWRLVPEGRGVHQLRNRAAPATALTVVDGRTSLAAWSGSDAQRWRIRRAPGGWITLTSLADSAVALAPASDPDQVRWQLVRVCELPREPAEDHRLPGLVEAEDFDLGCPGDAYRDSDDVNEGNLYRLNQGVDLGESSLGGFTLGWTRAGEWTAYTVDVLRPGTYRATFHVASARDGARFHLESEGIDLTGPVAVPNTRSFQSWTTIERRFELEAGRQMLRIVIDGDFVNLDKMVFDHVE